MSKINVKTIVKLTGLLLILLCLAGCSNAGDKDKTDTDKTDKTDTVDATEERLPSDGGGALAMNTNDPSASMIERINNGNDSIVRFIISTNGRFFARTYETPLIEYDFDGNIVERFEDIEHIELVCADAEYVYAYDLTNEHFISHNLSTRGVDVLSGEICLLEIKNGAVINGCLFVLAIPESLFDPNVEIVKGYADYGEKLYKINLSDGTISDTGVKGLISAYGSRNGELYLYSFTDDHYFGKIRRQPQYRG